MSSPEIKSLTKFGQTNPFALIVESADLHRAKVDTPADVSEQLKLLVSKQVPPK